MSMHQFWQQWLVLFLTIICLTMEACSSYGLLPRTHVIIRNNMGDGLTIAVHCMSTNDDLGVHVVKNGDNYEFAFGLSIFLQTTFNCTCVSNKGRVEWVAYGETTSKCEKFCEWKADTDGIKGSDGFNKWISN